MYAQGRGVPQDDAQAVQWFRKAAEQGHAGAQHNLGWMYRDGRGVEPDEVQAVQWYRKAVDSQSQKVDELRQQVAKSGSGRSELASELGTLSWYYLLNGQFVEAEAAAKEGYYTDSEQTWILINLAHAEMFLGHLDVAINVHAQRVNDVVMLGDGSKSWRERIANDFAAFRKAGLESPHMAAVERLMAAGDQN